MYKIYGYYYGERFEVLGTQECYLRILETPGVAIWGLDYLG